MKRHQYQALLDWKHQSHRNPLILMGVRQCGKTYLLQGFGQAEFPSVHYVNFEKKPALEALFAEGLDPRQIINALSFHLDTEIDAKRDLVIFDEIQACPQALTSLKYFQEEMPELALCAAGSLLGMHLTPGSFPVGKVTIMHLQVLSFSEFLLAIDDQKSVEFLAHCTLETKIPPTIHAHLWERLKWYFVVGGLPEVVDQFRQHLGSLYVGFEGVRAKQEMLIAGYYADIAKHAGKINAMHVNRVWRDVPSQLARAQNGSGNRFKFKGVVPGIDRYQRLVGAIDWLLAAGLVLKIPITNHAEVPLMAFSSENIFKLYSFDVGMLGALSGLLPKAILSYDYGTYKGYFAENFVAQEFLSSDRKDICSWKEGHAEIEFLMMHDKDILPIEVKSGWVTKSKSLTKFSDKYHPPYRTIMSAQNLRIDQKASLHCYPLYLAYRFPLSHSG